jgi:hypothetical protein
LISVLSRSCCFPLLTGQIDSQFFTIANLMEFVSVAIVVAHPGKGASEALPLNYVELEMLFFSGIEESTGEPQVAFVYVFIHVSSFAGAAIRRV